MSDEALEEIKKRKMREFMDKIKERGKTLNYPSSPVTVSDSNFESFIQHYPFVAVDFWASWCGPCQTIAPIIESLAKTYAEKVVFGKLNVDENPQAAWKYGITSIPSLVMIKNAVEVDRIVGVAPINVIEARLQRHL